MIDGYAIPDWIRATALDKLVPEDLLRLIVGCSELADYSAKLLWVRSQMEHARGATQAQYAGGAPTSKRDNDADMHMGAMTVDRRAQKPLLLWRLEEACTTCVQVGDWGGVAAIR